MDYSNIFTTYNSVDPIESKSIIEKPETSYTDPLQSLLEKFEENYKIKSNGKTSKKDSEGTEEKKEAIDYNFLNEYFLRNPQGEDSQPRQTSFKTQEDFVRTMRPIYEKVLIASGLNPEYATYLVSQSALESSWGNKQSGKFNLGGIKLPSKQKGKGLGTVRRTREVINGKETYIQDEFRNFKDLEDYANYHVNLLNNSRYNAFSGDFISNVVRGGYATDPKYKQILQSVYNQIKTNYG